VSCGPTNSAIPSYELSTDEEGNVHVSEGDRAILQKEAERRVERFTSGTSSPAERYETMRGWGLLGLGAVLGIVALPKVLAAVPQGLWFATSLLTIAQAEGERDPNLTFGLLGAATSVGAVSRTETALSNALGASAQSSLQRVQTAAPAGIGVGAASRMEFVKKVVNSNMAHAEARAVERAGFATRKEAREALQEFAKRLESEGILPADAIIDSAYADRVIVPGFGKDGAVVYQVTSEGVYKLKTVVIWRPLGGKP
jgi:hypothetical protein